VSDNSCCLCLVAGLGGCPYSPGATGNVATEARLSSIIPACVLNGQLAGFLGCESCIDWSRVRHWDRYGYPIRDRRMDLSEDRSYE
jgi:hypothetical protein